MNRYQEKVLFERFKSSYKKYPTTIKEIVDNQDKPDSVIITANNEKIGIEMTEAFQDNDNTKSSGSDLKETENLYQNIGNSIVSEVAKYSPEKFHLDISFQSNATFQKQRKKKIINELSTLIIKYLPLLEPKKPLVVSDFTKLPEGTIDFCILTHPKIPKSYFGNSHSGALRDLTNKHIEIILNDKDKAIEEYEKCDEHWLVIKIGHFLAGSFAKNRIDKSFDTKFDKIFIQDIQRSETVELKVKK